MRLIDGDKLILEVSKVWAELLHGDRKKFTADEMLMMIHNAPTVDPVKHGRWEYNIYIGWCFVGTEATADYMCSVCGWYTKMPTNYCPNCGSKNEVRE